MRGDRPTRSASLGPHRLMVRTPLFQGGNTGSIPVGVIGKFEYLLILKFSYNSSTGIEQERGRENICFPVEEGRAKPVGKPRVSEE